MLTPIKNSLSKNIRAMVIVMSQVASVNTKQTIAMEIITEEWLQIVAKYH